MREWFRARWAWVRARWLWFFVLTAAATFILGALSAIVGIKRTLAAAACILGLLTDCTVAGSKPRTLWDLLALILVPLALAVVGYFFSLKERQAEQDIAKQRAMDDALKSYLDAMGGLLTDQGLSESESPEYVRNLARAYTLTVLNRIDGKRRGDVVRFLLEARLITTPQGSNTPRVEMHGAQLQGSSLNRAILNGANLNGAILNVAKMIQAHLLGAELQSAELLGAILCEARMIGANLQRANLNGANLHQADLRRANLEEAYLDGAFLQGANLIGANLKQARLSGANLQGAYLQGACLEGVWIDQVQLDATETYRDAVNLPSHLAPDPRPWPRPAPAPTEVP